MKALSRITALIIVAFAFVSSNAQDFEGVWYPSSDEGMIGNIKIKKENGEYVVQYKTKAYGLKTSKGTVVNGALEFYFLEDTNYGEYWIGEWNGERDHILVGHDYGHYGTNGRAVVIYDRSYNSREKCATIEKEYWDFKLVPEGDNMVLYRKASSTYCVYDYGQGLRVVFNQGSWFFKDETYTNW